MLFNQIDLWSDDRGATAIEYGLIAALIAMAIIVSLNNFSDGVDGLYFAVQAAVDSVMNSNIAT